MKNSLTEIAFILDRSGSMGSIARSAIDGFNHFLREQQDAPGEARLTLVLFDDEYLRPLHAVPIAQAPPLNSDTYVPRNTTALLDAIGRTIDELGHRLATTAEPDRPGKIVVAILTDGLENASEKYSWKDVSQRIRHQTNVYGWDFLFLGANQDAIATAAQLHIPAANAATYQADDHGSHSSHAAISRRTSALRAAKASGAPAAPMPSMQEMLDEEDRKRRGT